MNVDPNPYPDYIISRLRSSAFVQNEYFGKIRRELGIHEGRGTKTGYSFMSRCFACRIRASIRVSIINSNTWEDTLSNHRLTRDVQLSMRKIMCRQQKLSSMPRLHISLSCSNSLMGNNETQTKTTMV